MSAPMAIAMIRGRPIAGINGTSATAQTMVEMLKIAGDSAGRK